MLDNGKPTSLAVLRKCWAPIIRHSVAGALGWKAIKIFGDSKLAWLRQYREFKTGIPTRHTIGRIIRGLSNEALLSSFARWINEQREHTGKPQIAFDGKTLRGTGKRSGTDALH